MSMYLKQACKIALGLGLAISSLALVLPHKAFSSPCCAGSGGQSVCVLPSEQQYQLGVSASLREIQGDFDPYGEYTPNPDGVYSRILSTVVGAAYRLNEDWQAGLSIPIVTNQNNLSKKTTSATGLGDPALEARYILWEDLSFLKYRPQLGFYGGVRLPIGKSIYNSSDPYNTNIVGDGTYTAHLGMNASKILNPVKLVLDGTYFYPFKKNVTLMHGTAVAEPYILKAGNRFQLIESGTFIASEHWSGSLGTKQLWVFHSSKNGETVEASAGRLFSTMAGINYFHDASWSFGLSYETAFPFYQYLENQANAQAVTLSAVFGGF